MRPVRTWLYVPGTRPDRIAAALAGPADAVVADLEDAVPAEHKARARATVVDLLARAPAGRLFVRVNDLRGPYGEADLAAVGAAGPAGIRLPKVESAEEVRVAAAVLDRAGCHAPLHPIVESALGVERCFEIATAAPRVAGLALGEADLAADLGVAAEEGLAWARSRLVVAARAAGLPRPPQSVYPRLRDPDGLRRSTLAGRALGFFGRSVIHPEQIAVVHQVVAPTPEEVARAREVVDAYAAARAGGSAAAVTATGAFVDPAVAAAARWTLEVAGLADAPQDAPQDRPQDGPQEESR